MTLGMLVEVAAFVGGVEQQVYDLSRALGARGHKVRLLFEREGEPDGARYRAAFEETATLGDPRALKGLTGLWAHRPAALERVALPGTFPVLVSAHDHALSCPRHHRYLLVNEAPCEEAPGAGCYLRGCVAVRSDNALGVLPLDPWATRERLRLLSKRARLVACSAFVAQGLVGAGAPSERVRVLHPVPPEDPTPVTPVPTELRLLVVGQLVHGKGVDLALTMLPSLPDSVTLDVVGEGPSRPALERLAQSVAPGRVRFHGWLDASGVRARYDAARVVLVPSRWPEPFGMVGLEAMRRGRPVVAAAHGGIPEWLPEGLCARFEPGNVGALARATARMLAHAETEGARAREHARRRFCFEESVRSVERLLQREGLLEAQRPSALEAEHDVAS